MKLPGSPSSLYDVRILGVLNAKADITGCVGAIDHKPVCFLSDWQLIFFIVFYLVLVKNSVNLIVFFSLFVSMYVVYDRFN